MVGWPISPTFLTLEIIPVVYTYWRLSQIRREQARAGTTTANPGAAAGSSGA